VSGARSDSQTGTRRFANGREARVERGIGRERRVGHPNRERKSDRPGGVERTKRRAGRLVADHESRHRRGRLRSGACPRDGEEAGERAENDGSNETGVHGVADTGAMSPMRPNVAPSTT
jgi:hypothetical protein